MKGFLNLTSGITDFLLGKKSIQNILKSEGANIQTLLDIEDLELKINDNSKTINDLLNYLA